MPCSFDLDTVCVVHGLKDVKALITKSFMPIAVQLSCSHCAHFHSFQSESSEIMVVDKDGNYKEKGKS